MECSTIAAWLASDGFEPIKASSLARATDELTARPFDLVILDAEIAFLPAVGAINVVRAHYPQTPIIVIGNPDGAESLAAGRGAAFLSRPLDRALLVCTASMTVMESRPVRRSERKRARLEVLVQGVPSEVVDVSKEGLRVEIPRQRKSAPPTPLFAVQVPILGVTLNVRRLWTVTAPHAVRDAIWYGGELSNNSKRVELAWSRLVDALPSSRGSVTLQ
jgi:hypothetical protein